MPIISLVTASFVTRELGYCAMGDWSEGDRATQLHFAPVESYGERFGALLDDIVGLGYRTIDLWGAHLHYSWATEDHFAIARGALNDRDISVNSLAAWCHDLTALRGFCRVANEVGAGIIAGGSPLFVTDRDRALDILRNHGVRFAIENHPEKDPEEVLEMIGESDWIRSCPDTGWWTIQGFDAPTAIRDLAGTIATVHLKDVDVLSGKGRRPGSGHAQIDLCLQALTDIGYEGAVGVEHEPDGWDPTEDLRSAYVMLSDWAARA